MTAGSARRMLLDAPVALIFGWVLWVAVQLPRMTGGPGPWNGEGPWDGGPVWNSGAMTWVPSPFVVIMMAGLVVRRVWPRVAFVLVAGAGIAYVLVGGSFGPALAATALCVYAVASHPPLRRWLPLTVLVLGLVLAVGWRLPYLGLFDPQTYGHLAFAAALTGAAALLAIVRVSRQDALRQRRTDELERAASDERLRVAREVHDVVGHSLSVISMQAGVALHVLDRRPEQIRPALEAIRTTSSEAMAELRHALGVFRDSEDSPTAPAPDLGRVDALVSALRAAGREVKVERTIPEGTELPTTVQQTAFRIVQESLTNVVRHAGSAAAIVRLSVTDGMLHLEVSDDGPLLSGPVSEGNGLRGMRERVASLGGRLVLEPRPHGGLTVRATLPTSTPITTPITEETT